MSVLLSLIGLLTACQSTATDPIVDGAGKPRAGSIAELTALELNGARQFVLIRGENRENPVILRVHGGPGQAEMAAEVLNRDLEKDFVVVEWDQRGAGKSAIPDSDYAKLSLGVVVSDTVALARVLNQRFGRKILLMGHSWGSVVGLLAAERNPELFAGFVSTGQIVDYQAGSAITYRDMLTMAANQRLDATSLRELGPPPYSDEARRQRYFGWMDKLGVSWHASPAMDRVGLMLRSPEYSWTEKLGFTDEAQKSFQALFGDLSSIRLEDHRTFSIPILFVLGAWDRLAPHELAQAYFDTIQAPFKQAVTFESSAHFPQYEEPQRFSQTVKQFWEAIQPTL